MRVAQAVIIISIHAPVQGATVIELFNHILKNISIHAPVQGATGT